MLHLSIGELTVGVEMSSNFSLGSLFKGVLTSFEKSQGWQTIEAISPELLKWLRLVQRRLGLYQYIIYISTQLLFAAIGMLKEMVFNWVAFVATRIHAKMGAK